MIDGEPDATLLAHQRVRRRLRPDGSNVWLVETPLVVG